MLKYSSHEKALDAIRQNIHRESDTRFKVEEGVAAEPIPVPTKSIDFTIQNGLN